MTQGVCSGDCNQDGVVTIDEVVLAIDIALGEARPDRGAHLDVNEDHNVTVDEPSLRPPKRSRAARLQRRQPRRRCRDVGNVRPVVTSRREPRACSTSQVA